MSHVLTDLVQGWRAKAKEHDAACVRRSYGQWQPQSVIILNTCADELEAALPSIEQGQEALIAALKTFAREVLDGYRTGVIGDIDGGWLQDKALELGLLVESGVDDNPNYYLAKCLDAPEARGEDQR